MSKWISPQIPKCNIENNLTIVRSQFKHGMESKVFPVWVQRDIVVYINEQSAKEGFEGYRIYHTDAM